MEIIAQPIDWTSTDEENLSKFLETETGKRFLPRLLETTPPLLAKGDINSILIRSGEVRGYQEVARNVLALAHSTQQPPEPESSSAYPKLDDDKAWGDGQKINNE